MPYEVTSVSEVNEFAIEANESALAKREVGRRAEAARYD